MGTRDPPAAVRWAREARPRLGPTTPRPADARDTRPGRRSGPGSAATSSPRQSGARSRASYFRFSVARTGADTRRPGRVPVFPGEGVASQAIAPRTCARVRPRGRRRATRTPGRGCASPVSSARPRWARGHRHVHSRPPLCAPAATVAEPTATAAAPMATTTRTHGHCHVRPRPPLRTPAATTAAPAATTTRAHGHCHARPRAHGHRGCARGHRLRRAAGHGAHQTPRCAARSLSPRCNLRDRRRACGTASAGRWEGRVAPALSPPRPRPPRRLPRRDHRPPRPHGVATPPRPPAPHRPCRLLPGLRAPPTPRRRQRRGRPNPRTMTALPVSPPRFVVR